MLAILVAGFVRIHDEQTNSTQELALLTVPTALKAELLALPDSHLYIQDMGHFELASYYEPDPEIRSRLALLYSHADELRYDLHDTASLTAEHMQHFTGFTIVPYAQLKAMPGEHVLVLYHSGWDWTDQALAADNAAHPFTRPGTRWRRRRSPLLAQTKRPEHMLRPRSVTGWFC